MLKKISRNGVTGFTIAEAAYKTTLLVFTGYIPAEHYLVILGEQAAQIEPDIQAIFESENDFEHDAFTALEYAYIGARYDKCYTIDETTVAYLAERVESLILTSLSSLVIVSLD